MDDLEEFHHQFMNEIDAGAASDGVFFLESFFSKAVDILSEAGEIDEGIWSYYSGSFSRKKIAVTGYGGDPREANGTLSLILVHRSEGQGVTEFGTTDIKKYYNLLVEYFRACRKAEFRDALEETSDCAYLAHLIDTTWDHIERIKFIVVTDAAAKEKSRVDARSVGTVGDIPVTYSVWDLRRLRKFLEQGQTREDLVIDFKGDFGGAVPVLRASGGEAALESYLAVVRGSQLASIYEKWGARLLESNVRSFLQARGNVNKGIRKTIMEEPHMFLPYNNGIAATADGITLEQTDEGLVMSAVDNLQIVNGGQTTASLHAVRKAAAAQLEEVYVQMKLNIVPRADAEAIVPKISEFANTQNKVNAADLSSNHPFHVRVEEMSRRILAPARSDEYVEARWFYERARGQYADQKAKLTPALQKKFEQEFPKGNLFTKTDLAKYEHSFLGKPFLVSLGAQKNFVKFSEHIAGKWGAEGTSFDDTWYRRMIAKAIVFKDTEKLVSEGAGGWYEGAYRANIVTYSIAKVVSDARKQGKVIDLDRIWKNQAVPSELRDALVMAGIEAQEVILHSSGTGIKHIGEWTKREACWKSLKEIRIEYDRSLDRVLVNQEEASSVARGERADTELTKSIQGETRVIMLGASFWAAALEWGGLKRALSPMDTRTLEVCAAIPSKIPTERQAQIALKVLAKLQNLGFEHPALSESAV